MRWVTGAIAALHLATVIQVLRDTHADEAVPRPWGPRDLAAAAATAAAGGTSSIERLAAPLLPWLRCARLVAAASPVNPAVRTTAATASRLAAAAAALPLAAERCLASLLTRPGRAAHSLP